MKLAIFDFNGTLFTEETLPFIMSQWHKQNYSKTRLLKIFIPLIPLYIKYKMGLNSNLSKEEMEVKAVTEVSKIFKGMNKKELNNFFSKAAFAARNYFNKKIIQEVYRSNKKGYQTVLLSGAFRPLLVQIGNELKIDTVIGSEFSFSKNSYSSNPTIEIISGSNKLKKINYIFKNKKIDWENSRAYADSYNDLQLLEAVGHPVAVAPDSKLASIAEERNWPVIE